MRTVIGRLLVVLVALAAAGAAGAMELEEIVAKHIEAKGGDGWDEIETMKMTGSFTAFSVEAPFELVRKRDHKLYLDHEMNGHPVTIGYDDEAFWWDHAMMGPGARAISEEADLQALEREIDFATPLFDWAERGFELELLGETEFEGFPAIAIQLTRPDETVETWYLDPDTYLELAREAPGSDFGQPMPARTFFDDFREVAGVMIPFYVETQWYTRDRVMRLENVEVNVPVDDALFAMPAPPGMDRLIPMADTWKVTTSVRPQPGVEWQESEREGAVEGMMRGALLSEKYADPEGNEVFWTLSFDQYRDTYRLTRIDSVRNLQGVLEGTWNDEGKLVLSDLDTGTTWEGFGMTFHTRVTFHEIEDDGFRIDTEISTDGGENWFLAAKQAYERAGE
jgi:hypothetical protein